MGADALGYRHLTAEQAVATTERLRPLLDPRPPSDEGPAEFVGRVREASRRPGFAMVVAYDGDDPVGLAYGHTMPAGEWWRGVDRTPPPEMLAAEKFALMEWAVSPESQRRGIGQRLLDELLGSRPETFGILAVSPAAPARGIFERLGWRHVGSTRPAGTPATDIMVSLVNCGTD